MHYEAFVFRNYRLITAAKAAIAVGIAIAVGQFTPEGGWIAVTAIVLMAATPHVGDVMSRSIQRLIGTIVAGAIALLAVSVFDHQVAAYVVLVAGVMVFSWYGLQSRYGYVGEMVAMTLVILLAFVDTTARLVGWRAINIAIGGAIAFAVTRFVFPIRGERRFHFAVAQTLASLADFYDLVTGARMPSSNHVAQMQSEIDHKLATQRELVSAARVERIGAANEMIDVFENIVHTEAEMLFSVIVIRRERWRSDGSRRAIDSLPGFPEHRQVVLLSLRSISETAATEEVYAPPKALLETSQKLVDAMPDVEDPSLTSITPHSFSLSNNELSAQIVRVSNLLRRLALARKAK